MELHLVGILTMLEHEHYVGVDVGTGSARACVVDHKGNIKALVSKEIRTWQPHTDYYEQSTSDIWRSISICVKQALEEGNVRPVSVRGIGFCATCSLAVFSNTTDSPISVSGPEFDNSDQNVILWLDRRPVLEAKRINETEDCVLKYVGGKMSLEMEIPKILWLKNNMPLELFEECKFYDLADALTHIATNSETRSFCSTVCKQGYLPDGVDGNRQGWRDDFFEAIGLGCFKDDGYSRLGGINGKNGTYLSAGELIGGLCERAASDLGLPKDIPVGSGVIDAYAGWIGTVGAKHNLSTRPASGISQTIGRLAVVAGTSTCHLAMSEGPVFIDGIWGPYRDVLIPGFWMTEGGQSATGKLLTHVLESYPAYQVLVTAMSEGGNCKSPYDWLNDCLEELGQASHAPSIAFLGRHFHFYGDIFGNRSPLADPTMRGSIIGISSDKSTNNLALTYYGVLEFIALQTRHIVDVMRKSGLWITSLYMSGSQCQNSLLMSLIANSCNMPVVIPQYVNAAVVHGAAMLGAKAASGGDGSLTADLWSVIERMSKAGSVVMPEGNAMEKRLLDAKYKVFLEQSETQRRYRQEVDAATRG